jgi:DNA-directed RNA polymerase specialized sigma subunit
MTKQEKETALLLFRKNYTVTEVAKMFGISEVQLIKEINKKEGV